MAENAQDLKPNVVQRLKATLKNIIVWIKGLSLSKASKDGAVQALTITAVMALMIYGFDFQSGYGRVIDVALAGVIAVLGMKLLIGVNILVLGAVKKLPIKLTAAAVAALIFVAEMWRLSLDKIIWLSLGVVLVAGGLGIVIGELRAGGWQQAGRGKRVVLGTGLALTLGLNIALIYWIATPGWDTHLLDINAARGAPQIAMGNPAEVGPYEVLTLTYGNGTDRHRPEYGENADLLTPSVNASAFLSISGFEKISREMFWGFDEREFPLNARVWYPDGEGSFPLVLIVHGNHDMVDFSDTGYGYLGELLASRGYIFISVDENFLNGYFSGGFNEENDARAWLLLKHIELWEGWNAGADDTPFEGLVDMEKIALIGHSRGGEAAATAAAFNQLARLPEDGNIQLDFGFNIRSVIAIAPSDQQYKPAGQPTPLTDINYLVLQGAHDGDVFTFTGIKQYQRVSFSDPESDLFRAAVYIYRANHGQFNTSWGQRDFEIPRGWLQNTQPFIDGDAQREIAKVYISAFLDATLRGEDEYIPLFQDHRTAGDWLPPTLYINQYHPAGYIPLVTFEEDIDLTTGTLLGSELSGRLLSLWREDELEFRTGRAQDNQAVQLGWSSERGRYTLILPLNWAGIWGLNEEATLVFSMADDRQDEIEGLIDLSIVLRDANGDSASLTMSDYGALLPQFPSQFTKFPAWEVSSYKEASEPVFQTFYLPLRDFMESNSDLNLASLVEISFSFDVVDDGRVILDDIGVIR